MDFKDNMNQICLKTECSKIFWGFKYLKAAWKNGGAVKRQSVESSKTFDASCYNL